MRAAPAHPIPYARRSQPVCAPRWSPRVCAPGARLFALSAWAVVCVARVSLAEDGLSSPTGTGAAGGVAESPRAPREAGFRVHRDGDRWTLQSPDGTPFFSLGVSVLTQGTARDAYDDAKPAYAAWRYYPSPTEWADSALTRLKAWQFTTIGGWADYGDLDRSSQQTLAMTPVISLGANSGAPWLDMWDEQRLETIDRLASAIIDPLRDNPRVIGYYSDNELGWWNAELWRLTWEHEPTSKQRQALFDMVRRDYCDDWEKMMRDFTPTEGVDGWDALSRGGGLRHRPGSEGIRTMRRFLALAADRYYDLMSDVIRRHDPDALYLGDRYQSFYYPEVATAAGKHVDVVSTNLSAHWSDGAFLRCYLDSLHALAQRPLLVSEFYMCATENRSGNKNSTRGFPVVATQSLRASSTRRSLDELVRRPYILGVEWFQFFDEPPHGRFDGEDFNFGLVDIEDRPYDDVTQVFATFDFSRSGEKPTARRADATQGVPPAPADPGHGLGYMTSLQHWDRERGFVPGVSDAPLADLYACWQRDALFLGLYAVDIVEKSYYVDGRIHEEDRAVWTLQIGESQPITIRIGGGEPPIVDDKAIAIETYSGVDHNARLIAVARIPAERCGRTHWAPGDQVSIDSVLSTHGRAYEYAWRGTYTVSP